VLEVYNRIGALVHHLTRRVKLLTNVVPCVLGLAKVTIHNLQLPILVYRRNCTTMEKVILALQLCELAWGNDVVLFISGHTQTLLDNNHGSVVLQVEWVLHILGHNSHAGVEVWALRVGYSLKALLPHRVSPIANQKKRDRHRSGVSKATPTQWSEGDLCRLIDGVIKLNTDNGGHPWLFQTERNGHADLTLLHVMSHGHASTVDRNVPVVAEVEECVV
jgi:hypothetical protein